MHREGADDEVERRVLEWQRGHVRHEELGHRSGGARGTGGLLARAPDFVRIHVDGSDGQPVVGRQADGKRARTAADLEDRSSGRSNPGDVVGDRAEE